MQPPTDASKLESPAWHDDVLRETEQRYEAGQERPVDWATAQQELRARLRLTRDQKDMATLKISIPDDQQEWIAAQVAAGRYANASDYVQELIRRDQQARESLELALIDGERSGVSECAVSDVARQARQRLRG